MLILTRKVNESIMIGDEISFRILGLKGNQIRIGVTAPHDIPVHREEIYLRIQNDKKNGKSKDKKKKWRKNND